MAVSMKDAGTVWPATPAPGSTRQRKSPADIDAHSRAQPVRERPLYTHSNSAAKVSA